MERDILWQGQIFCTSHYVCFYGKLFAKAVRVMIHFQDVVRIEKMNSLVVIPNALRVGTSTKQVGHGNGNSRVVGLYLLVMENAF